MDFSIRKSSIKPPFSLGAAATYAEFPSEPGLKFFGPRVADQAFQSVAEASVGFPTVFGEGAGPSRPLIGRQRGVARARGLNASRGLVRV